MRRAWTRKFQSSGPTVYSLYCAQESQAQISHTDRLGILRMRNILASTVKYFIRKSVEKSAFLSKTLGRPNICVYKIPLNKIHYKTHFNNCSSCIFCFYIVHLSKLVPRLHCLHAAVFVTCDHRKPRQAV